MSIFCHILGVLFFMIIFPLWDISSEDKESKHAQVNYHEITRIDITRLSEFEAQRVSVLGVYLNMSMKQAKSLLARKHGMYLIRDDFNHTRYYLYEVKKNENGKHVPLAYFKWQHRDSGLKEIILYPGFAKYMAGKSSLLVTREVMNFKAKWIHNFLGYPVGKTQTLSVPSLDLFQTDYYYFGKAIKVIKQVSGNKVIYAFSLFDENVIKKMERKDLQ